MVYKNGKVIRKGVKRRVKKLRKTTRNIRKTLKGVRKRAVKRALGTRR